MPTFAVDAPPANPFDAASPLHAVYDALVSRDPLPALVVPGNPWRPEIAQTLQTARTESTVPEPVLAALHLLNDDLDAAHVLVQDDTSQTGSYLHYLVHRREGDWSNTRYWAARTGEHPIFATLAQRAGRRKWDARAAVGEMETANWQPHDSLGYVAAAKLSAQEMAEAIAWCAANEGR